MNIVISVLFGLLLFSPGKLVPTKVADGITVPMPKHMRPMSEGEMVLQSPSVRAPLAAYTSSDRTADFTVNISATRWPDRDVELAKRFFKAGVENLFDRVDYIQDDIREINGKQYIVLEFESRINGSKLTQGQREPIMQYHYTQYLLEPKRTLVFSFHCARAFRYDWEVVVNEMMAGVKVK